MEFSLSQGLRSLMVCILRKYFYNVCVLVCIIPVHVGSCMHIPPWAVWPAVRVGKHPGIPALKAFGTCTFPRALSGFICFSFVP